MTLQDHDTRISQLLYRHKTLPQRDTLAASQAAQRALEQQKQIVDAQLLELQRNLKRSEDDLVGLETRVQQESERLYSGELTATRDLLALQHEIEGLRMRCSEAENEVLGLLENVEQVNAARDDLDSQLVNTEAEVAEVRERLTAAEAEVQAEIDLEIVARKTVAGEIADEALVNYEGLRKRLGGVAVARLRDGICEGCHLALSAKEQDRIRRLPISELCHCEECGCILVRT
ncbi:MAG: hypothetical protein F4138_01415 [Acidimicrobiia bacterium]|nr:hypothetical protein [Acidimicrobiia bacterium]